MCDWTDFKFNESYEGKEICSVLGVPLPVQYIEFMKIGKPAMTAKEKFIPLKLIWLVTTISTRSMKKYTTN